MFKRTLKELHRRRAVRRLDLLSSKAEPQLDTLVDRVASAFEAPIALLSIADGDQFQFKSKVGVARAGGARRESFCTHVLDRDDLLEVCNAAEDDMFSQLAVVSGKPNIRYYLGMRLRLSDGSGVGALCILDTKERSAASRDQRAFLKAMAHQAELALEFNHVVASSA